MRLLANFIVIGVLFGLVSTADAQVFKPKGKKADVSEKKPAKAKKAKASTKKVSKKKKNAAADRSRPDDLTPEPASKSGDDDFVKITDDDEIE
jgi:hypothetical protein